MPGPARSGLSVAFPPESPCRSLDLSPCPGRSLSASSGLPSIFRWKSPFVGSANSGSSGDVVRCPNAIRRPWFEIFGLHHRMRNGDPGLVALLVAGRDKIDARCVAPEQRIDERVVVGSPAGVVIRMPAPGSLHPSRGDRLVLGVAVREEGIISRHPVCSTRAFHRKLSDCKLWRLRRCRSSGWNVVRRSKSVMPQGVTRPRYTRPAKRIALSGTPRESLRNLHEIYPATEVLLQACLSWGVRHLPRAGTRHRRRIPQTKSTESIRAPADALRRSCAVACAACRPRRPS